MGYVDAWDDFYAQAESLFLADPQNTRYVIKYRHVDSKLVLKVTDNKVVSELVFMRLGDVRVTFLSMLVVVLTVAFAVFKV